MAPDFPVLRAYKRYPHPVAGDGNCLFNALSDQLYGHERRHLNIRQDVLKFIRDNPDYAPPAPSLYGVHSMKAYYKSMEKSGVWADEPEVAAFAAAYGCDVFLYHEKSNDRLYYPAVEGQVADKQLHIAFEEYGHYWSGREAPAEEGVHPVKQDDVAVEEDMEIKQEGGGSGRQQSQQHAKKSRGKNKSNEVSISQSMRNTSAGASMVVVEEEDEGVKSSAAAFSAGSDGKEDASKNAPVRSVWDWESVKEESSPEATSAVKAGSMKASRGGSSSGSTSEQMQGVARKATSRSKLSAKNTAHKEASPDILPSEATVEGAGRYATATVSQLRSSKGKAVREEQMLQRAVDEADYDLDDALAALKLL